MALSKSFLGLGFTFSATDKGLEKKLRSIKASLEGINDALSGISSNGSDASSAIGKIKSGPKNNFASKLKFSKKSRSSQIGRKGLQAKDKTTRFSDVITKDTEDFLSNIAKKVLSKNTDLLQAFSDKISGINLKLDSTGNILEKDKEKLFAIAKNLKKVHDLDQKLFLIQELKFFFSKDIPAYLGRVRNEMERFLSSIGLNVRELLPEPIKALAGVVKTSIVDPLLGAGKALLRLTGITDAVKNLFSGDKQKNKIAEEIRALKDEIAGSGVNTTNNLLKKIKNELTKEKSSGFGTALKLLGIAAAIAAGAVFGLAERFMSVLKSFKPIKNLLELADSKLAQFVSVFSKNTEKVKAALNSFSSVLKAKSLKIADWMKGLTRSIPTGLKQVFGLFKSDFSGLSGILGKFTGWVKGLIGGADIGSKIASIGTKLSEAMKFLSPFIKIGAGIGKKLFWPLTLLDVFQGFTKAFKEESNFFIAMIKGIFYSLDNFFFNMPSFLAGYVKSFFASKDEKKSGTVQPSQIVIPDRATTNLDLSDISEKAEKQSQILNKQLTAADETNALLSKLVSIMSQPEPNRTLVRQSAGRVTSFGSESGRESGES